MHESLNFTMFTIEKQIAVTEAYNEGTIQSGFLKLPLFQAWQLWA